MLQEKRAARRQRHAEYGPLHTFIYHRIVWLLVLVAIAFEGVQVEGGPLHLECDPCIDRTKLEIHAVVHGTMDDSFWQQSRKAMLQTARDMGVDANFHIELQEVHSSKEMAKAIRNLIQYELCDHCDHGHTHNARQIDGLIVTIPDDLVKEAVYDAVQAGIHVFGMNVGYSVARELGILSYVAQNEYLAGGTAAMEFQRRRLQVHGPAQRALFLNHDAEDPALAERFRGFNDTLSPQGIQVEELVIDADDFYKMIIEIHNNVAECLYDYILLGGSETLPAITAAFEYHQCEQSLVLEGEVEFLPENTTREESLTPFYSQWRPVMIGTFDANSEVLDSIAASEITFALGQQSHLQSALPVIMSTLYATTGQRLPLPFEEDAYLSGPRVFDISNNPSDTYLSCVSEAFPICEPGGDSFEDVEDGCPCTERSRLRIAGVVHGVVGDPFWDDVSAAAFQAGLDMDVDFEMTRFDPEESDAVLHRKMASKIMSLCGSGINGLMVSMPSVALVEAVRFCKQLRIPVININSGYEFARELDVQHVGQLESNAGVKAGQRMLLAGVETGYCLVHEPDNIALLRRCDGFGESLESANKTYGGIVFVPRDSATRYMQVVEDAVGDPGNWDSIGLLINGDLGPALDIQRSHQSVALGTFDLRPDIFEPLDNGRLLFTIDQQQFLQGSLPVYLLALAAYTNQALLNTVIETGPALVEYSPSQSAQTCEELKFGVCTRIPQENFNFIPSYFQITGYAAVGAVCLFGLISLIWMFCYREKNIVKASQPLFLVLLVLGTTLMIAAIMPLSAQTGYRYLKDPYTGEMTDEPNPEVALVDIACILTPWLYGIGFVLTFSALCAKVQRVKMIYDAGAAMRRKKVEVKDVLTIMMAMFLLEVTILVCWTLLSRPTWERNIVTEVDGYVLESYGSCYSEHNMIFAMSQNSFHVVCLIYVLFLCWQTSEIPTEFAEGSYISLSVLCIFQISVLTIPLRLMVYETPDVDFFVESMSIFLGSFTVLLLIFLPKMWRVCTGDDQLPIARSGRQSNHHTNNGGGNSAHNQFSVATNTHRGESHHSEPSTKRPSAPAKPSAASDGFARDRGSSRGGSLPALEKMAPMDSEYDIQKERGITQPSAVAITTVAGAREHLKAGLDAETSSSSSADDLLPGSDQFLESADEELANLAAEISRASQSRAETYASAGETAPAIEKSKRQSPTNTAEPSEGRAREPFKRQDSPVDNSSVTSSGSDPAKGVVSTARKPFKRPGSPIDDSSVTSGGSDPAKGIVSTAVPSEGTERKPFKRPGSPIDDSSVASGGSDPAKGVVVPSEGGARKPFKRPGSPIDDSSVTSGASDPLKAFLRKDSSSDDSSSDSSERSDPLKAFLRQDSSSDDSSVSSSDKRDIGGSYHNPQEGSHASNDIKKGEQESLESSQKVESDSNSTTASKAAASRATIFRKPEPKADTPIRLKKDPSSYGENATLALSITKVGSNFLRRVAASYGMVSTVDEDDKRPGTQPVYSPSKVVLGDLHKSSAKEETAEFDVSRQNGPQFAALKESAAMDEETGMASSSKDKSNLQPKATALKESAAMDEETGMASSSKDKSNLQQPAKALDGDVLYFL